MNWPAVAGLGNGEKFALLAVGQCSSRGINQRLDLPDGTIVLPKGSDLLDDQWRTWLGEIRSNQIQRASLLLIRHAPSANSAVLDAENEALRRATLNVFALLQFAGMPSYATGIWLTGSVERNHLNIRQIGDMRPFFRPSGCASVPVTAGRLKQADELAASWRGILQSAQYKRFIRGANALIDALQQSHGPERLHQAIRSLKALTMPKIGATRGQFIHRCQTFVGAGQQQAALLGELFDMRSAVEHLHEWDHALTTHPQADRPRIAERRARQAQALATTAYIRVLLDSTVQAYFATDTSIASFWQQQDHHRAAIWGKALDILNVP